MRASALLAGVALVACSPARLHIFGGYLYDAARDCVEDAAAIDVIEGEDPGRCDAVVCWVSPEGDVVVTTQACDAPPGYVEHTTDAEGTPCALALAAYARGDAGRCE